MSELRKAAYEFSNSYKPKSKACQCDCGYCAEDFAEFGAKWAIERTREFAKKYSSNGSIAMFESTFLEFLQKLEQSE